MTFAQLNQRIRENNAPLFAKAEVLSALMATAIALDTIHARRLRTLRAGLRNKIASYDPVMLRTWIGEFGAAIDAECSAAFRTADTAIADVRLSERRAA